MESGLCWMMVVPFLSTFLLFSSYSFFFFFNLALFVPPPKGCLVMSTTLMLETYFTLPSVGKIMGFAFRLSASKSLDVFFHLPQFPHM